MELVNQTLADKDTLHWMIQVNITVRYDVKLYTIVLYAVG